MKRDTTIGRRGAATAAFVVALMLAACLTTSSALAGDGSCSNEARRTEQFSSYLPNCRAYELVTPLTKDSGEPEAIIPSATERNKFEPIHGAFAAVDGDRMAWISEDPGLSGPDSDSLGLDYLSTRGPEGWGTEATVPPQSKEVGLACPEESGMLGWSSNLTKGILADGGSQRYGETSRGGAFFQEFGCGHAEPALTEADGATIAEPAGFQNLFLRDDETSSYQLVNVTPAGAPSPTPKEGFQSYFHPAFLAGSTDLERVAFEDELPLTEEAEKLSPETEAGCKEEPKGRACWEGHDDLYEWSEGQQPAVRLVTMLPDGKPVDGALAGSTRNSLQTNSTPTNVADYGHAVSADGTRIFFEAEGDLYVRENGGLAQSAIAPKSAAVNGEQCTEPEKACTIQLDLAENGAPGSGGGGKWVGASAAGTRIFFTDEAVKELTSTTRPGSGTNLYEYELPSKADRPGTLVDLTADAEAEVLGVSGISEDGSYVYFVADGALQGTGENGEKAAPQVQQPNLYVNHDGQTTFIATLSGEDLCDWTSDTGCNLEEPGNPMITGLTARISGNGLYLAFNSVNQLTGYDNMGSTCSPISNPVGYGSCEEIFLYEVEGGRLACASCNPSGPPSAHGAAIEWPAGPDRAWSIVKDTYPQRNVSESGQVFFDTSEALLPSADTNGLSDVYEYEHGALHLISSGRSSAPSYFLDATPSGSDVFFATAQKLLRRDTDSAYDIYDARTDGGFAEPSPPPPPCEGESECKGSAGTAPVFAPPPSVTFAGPGNLLQTKAAPKAKPKKSAQRQSEAKLHSALQKCTRRYRRTRERRLCKERARKRLSHKAKAAARARKPNRRSHKGGHR